MDRECDPRHALERGEIEGTLANAWSSLNQTDWLKRGLVRVIIQHGFHKSRALPDVPLSRDLGRDEAERQMVDVMNVRDEITRPYVAPPGLPPARLDMLRRAFDATLHDEDFLADVHRQQLEIDEPMSGEELAAVAERIAKTPPAVLQRLGQLFSNYKEAR